MKSIDIHTWSASKVTMLFYAVSVPGNSGHIFQTRKDALVFIEKNPNCYLRQFTNLREAEEFVNSGNRSTAMASAPRPTTLSIPDCTVIHVEPSDGKFIVTTIDGSGKRTTMTNKVPDNVKSPSIICVIAMFQLMSLTPGHIKFVCKDETISKMYKDSSRWINYREKSTFSELIAATFKMMQERQVELLSKPPLGLG